MSLEKSVENPRTRNPSSAREAQEKWLHVESRARLEIAINNCKKSRRLLECAVTVIER